MNTFLWILIGIVAVIVILLLLPWVVIPIHKYANWVWFRKDK